MENFRGMRKNRSYDENFKKEALKQVASGKTSREVAYSLGIAESLLSSWRIADKKMLSATELEDLNELDRLRKRNAQLEIEKDILKKALSLFSRGT